jgi:hypothetical protein
MVVLLFVVFGVFCVVGVFGGCLVLGCNWRGRWWIPWARWLA